MITIRHLHRNNYWLSRFLAADPGRKRLNQAGKATISLISAIFTTLLILHGSGQSLFTPAIVSGMAGLMGIMVVMDDTKQKKQLTTVLLAVSASLGITAGSLLSSNAILIGTVMVAVIFCAFYFSKYGSRYFSLGMIGFMTLYFSSILKLSPVQLPWFYLGVAIGICYAFLYNFVIFKDSAQILKGSMRSFHIQANLTFQILISLMEDPKTSKKRLKSLKKNNAKLGEYARNVSVDLSDQDVRQVWPGLSTSQLRLYVFDTAMLMETLTDSVQQLKKAEALEAEELKKLLIWVVKSLRDAEVLAQNYKEQHLQEAEKAVQALRLDLAERLHQAETASKGWLYLIRRIESIANHVIEGAASIQTSLHLKRTPKEDQEDEKEAEETDSKEEKGLKPTTKKAIQALIAGGIAIVVGYLISPAQPYWVVLTTFIVQLGTDSVGRTYVKGLQRSLGTVIGAVIGFFLAQFVSGHSVLEIGLLFVEVFFAFYLFSVSYTLMSMFITMLIAFMYDLLLGGISLSLLGARVLDTIAGAAIALGVSAFILPKRTRDKVDDALVDYIDELSPYIRDYVKRFHEPVNVKKLADRAFTLDQNLQVIKDEAQSLLQRPGMFSQSSISRWITIFTAMNYYAKHLVASSYQKEFDYPGELIEVFRDIEEKTSHNLEHLKRLIRGKAHAPKHYSLKKEREAIERLAPGRHQSKGDLIHHLYYIWRINQSIVLLGKELGGTNTDH
ncbi:FUSC family protein [Halobacillus salinarum]|uniref:FUSC family protein n=1 Tax=Halobacillus salinarum TaxID=2932257 RepID=A0ABY4EGN1_9BACI|nr:FUSC family protein [Halobacillus salinarum]UOQ43630.1 FUSC family protein [Halobacillus salinarum]